MDTWLWALPGAALAFFLGILAREALWQRRYRRQAQETALVEAEQMLRWEAEGHQYRPYRTTWIMENRDSYSMTTPGYWPQVSARAEQDSRGSHPGMPPSPRPCYHVQVAVVDPGGGGVTEWTWAHGELIEERRR
ncbi:hypothetical protein [Nonomuraea rhodomycinica]|uniref:Uncharacterized protein n=1 Tax=Nonomuraea rhodomycinica TaxID=1712872 RepID=A0A7Y6IZ47_9ACTN|nr:hypothetical protein [Nonomuraea rhodomycinica]NUW47020.1 hypothetical protein [Nonomuraea rhodomycinica]